MQELQAVLRACLSEKETTWRGKKFRATQPEARDTVGYAQRHSCGPRFRGGALKRLSILASFCPSYN
jgi:hypothetical protein